MRLREIKGQQDCPYEVGDLYITTSGTNPAERWAGTSWNRIENAFLVAGGSKWAPGTTGGSETHTHTTGDVTLTTDQIPSHKHSVGAHAHGLNSHTHTYAKPNTPTGGTAINVAQMASHNHHTYGYYQPTSGTGGVRKCISADQKLLSDGVNANYSDTGSDSAHTHTIGTTSTNSGGPSAANTANSAAFDSGAVGGGKAHNHGATGGFSLPPYLAVRVWKRTA